MKNNLIISGLHLDLTVPLKKLVHDKMEKIFKHEEKIIRARIELDHDARSSSHQNEFTAKGHLELKGATLRAQGRTPGPRGATCHPRPRGTTPAPKVAIPKA